MWFNPTLQPASFVIYFMRHTVYSCLYFSSFSPIFRCILWKSTNSINVMSAWRQLYKLHLSRHDSIRQSNSTLKRPSRIIRVKHCKICAHCTCVYWALICRTNESQITASLLKSCIDFGLHGDNWKSLRFNGQEFRNRGRNDNIFLHLLLLKSFSIYECVHSPFGRSAACQSCLNYIRSN